MNRLKNIDILKCIGLFCIILAHVSPPKILFQIRNFDVVLMIMVSALLFFYRYESSKENYKKYLCKRIKRLILPTWTFLIIFFTFMILFNHKFSTQKVISSFLLHDGIGYVWVIRVYLIVACLLPFLYKLYNLSDMKKVIIINITIYLIYEVLCYFKVFNYNIFLKDIIAYIIPCITIITVTYFIKNSNNKRVLNFAIVNLLIFIFIGVKIYIETETIQDTNYMKYPFRLYYLSYAFGISAILILILRNNSIVDFLHTKLIIFISKSSLWIYLWHILFLYIFKYSNLNLSWIVKYIIIVICSMAVVYVQNKIINKLEKTNINKEILDIFKG